jgi:hypothetical protein
MTSIARPKSASSKEKNISRSYYFSNEKEKRFRSFSITEIIYIILPFLLMMFLEIYSLTAAPFDLLASKRFSG